eukprot:490844-Amphidinium_carterae.1
MLGWSGHWALVVQDFSYAGVTVSAQRLALKPELWRARAKRHPVFYACDEQHSNHKCGIGFPVPAITLLPLNQVRLLHAGIGALLVNVRFPALRGLSGSKSNPIAAIGIVLIGVIIAAAVFVTVCQSFDMSDMRLLLGVATIF